MSEYRMRAPWKNPVAMLELREALYGQVTRDLAVDLDDPWTSSAINHFPWFMAQHLPPVGSGTTFKDALDEVAEKFSYPVFRITYDRDRVTWTASRPQIAEWLKPLMLGTGCPPGDVDAYISDWKYQNVWLSGLTHHYAVRRSDARPAVNLIHFRTRQSGGWAESSHVRCSYHLEVTE